MTIGHLGIDGRGCALRSSDRSWLHRRRRGIYKQRCATWRSSLKKTADLAVVAGAALSIQLAALDIEIIDSLNDELCNNPVGSIHGKRTG